MRHSEPNHIKVREVGKELDVMTIRLKIEKNHLVRICHIARTSDERLVKQTAMSSNRRMEMGRKSRKREMITLAYWHKLLKKANIELHEVGGIAMDRVIWKYDVESIMRHIEQFKKQKGDQYRRHEVIIQRRSHYEVQDDNKYKY